MRGWKQIDNKLKIEILNVIEKIDGKISWNRIIDEVYLKLKRKYTRQSLYKHREIRAVYEKKKNDGPSIKKSFKYDSLDRKRLIQKLEILEKKNQQLLEKNHNLLEQFTLWAYNAHLRGLGPEILNRPLPSIEREQSVDIDMS